MCKGAETRVDELILMTGKYQPVEGTTFSKITPNPNPNSFHEAFNFVHIYTKLSCLNLFRFKINLILDLIKAIYKLIWYHYGLKISGFVDFD